MSSSARGRARSDSIAEPDVLDNLASFTRHLRAENKAPSTIATYAKAVEQFELFLADVRREYVEAFPPASRLQVIDARRSSVSPGRPGSL